MLTRTHLLILCTGNAARSRMAEGLWQRLADEEFEIASAGTTSTAVEPEAVAVMQEIGIDISASSSRSIDEFAGQRFGILLIIGGEGDEGYPALPDSDETIRWSIDDPAAIVGGSEQNRHATFRRVRDELRRRIASELALREPV